MNTKVILIRRLALAATLATSSACTSKVLPVQSTAAPLQQQSDRSYIIGRLDSAFVGSTILRIRDYFLIRIGSPVLVANDDFTWGRTCRGAKGQRFTVAGQLTFRGSVYDVMQLPCSTAVAQVLVSRDGRLAGYEMTTGSPQPVGFSPEPPTLALTREQAEQVDRTKPYANYELLYSGTDGQSFGVEYREFSPDDFARPAYFQSLKFPNASPTIRFRHLILRVHTVTAEKIVFTVISDT